MPRLVDLTLSGSQALRIYHAISDMADAEALAAGTVSDATNTLLKVMEDAIAMSADRSQRPPARSWLR